MTIGIRAFAKLVGVSPAAIRKAIRVGRLTAIDQDTGKLHRDEALGEWESLHRPVVKEVDLTPCPSPEKRGGNENLTPCPSPEKRGGELEDQPEAQNWGIAYTRESALLKREQRRKVTLETDELEGRLHRTEDIEAAWSEIIAAARAKLLSLPNEVAGAIAAKLKRDKLAVQEIVAREVERVLTELATDAGAKIGEHRSRRVRKSPLKQQSSGGE